MDANMSVNGDKSVWQKSETISFIQMYESFPELWNSNVAEYKERDIKSAAVQKLSEAFNIPNEDVRRKIHNLRCQYNSEVRKIKKKSPDLGLNESKITSEWKYFEHMRFLSGAHNRTVANNIKKTELEDSINFYDSDDYQEEPIPTPRKTPLKKIDPISDSVYIPNEINEVNLPARTMVEDDYRIFGEFVASELRNLNDRNAKRLKLMINKAIIAVAEEEYLGYNPKEESL